VFIKSGYPRLAKYSQKLAAYLALVRPLTLVAPLVVGLFGVGAVSLHYHMSLDFTKMMLVSTSLMLLQAYAQVTNQIADIDADRVNKPYRPLPSGKISVNEAWQFSGILLVTGLLLAATQGYCFLVLCLAMLFFSLTYSFYPFRIKRYLWINLVWLAFGRGFFPLLACWSTVADINEEALALATHLFLYVFALQSTKDFQDVVGDLADNVKTLPNTYGVRKACRYMALLIAADFYVLCGFILAKILSAKYLLLAIADVVGVACVDLTEREAVFENNLGWVLYYIGLGLNYILLFTAEILDGV